MGRRLPGRRGLALLAGITAISLATSLTDRVQDTIRDSASASALPIASPPSNLTLPSLPTQHGFNLLLLGDASFRQLDDVVVDLRRIGADSLAITFLFSMSSYRASSVSVGPRTPSDMTLDRAIEAAHHRALRVMLRPILDESTLPPSQWRGSIQPTDPAAWFASYTELLTGWAALAESEGVEILDVGSELDSMEVATSWSAMIAKVRRIYHGLITYSSNFDSLKAAMYTALDFVSVDAYWSLDAPARPTAEQLVTAWQRPLRQMLAAANGKPVVLTELGVVPQAGIHLHPQLWVRTGAQDLEAQRIYYEAACQAMDWQLLGLYWWDVTVPPESSDFSPLGRPAEGVVRRCFSHGPNEELGGARANSAARS